MWSTILYQVGTEISKPNDFFIPDLSYSANDFDLAINNKGQAVIVWQDYIGEMESQLMFREFTFGSKFVSDEFVLGDGSDEFESNTSVDINNLGDFVISWTGRFTIMDDPYVKSRKFNFLDLGIVNPVLIESRSSDYSRVRVDRLGQFTLTWFEGSDLFVRRY